MNETIPLLNLLFLSIPLLFTAWIYWKWCNQKWEIGYATLRMVSQLILIGYALLFLFENDKAWIGGFIFLMMIMMSTVIGVRPFKGKKVFLYALLSIGSAGTLILLLIIFTVLQLSPSYQPRVVIPLAGMVYSSSMNTISLSGERYYTERKNGSTLIESRANAFKAALIPNINSYLAVGLVSLPGMMTGQILSGVSPLIAVRYQIMVMAMLLGAAGLSASFFLWLISRKASKHD